MTPESRTLHHILSAVIITGASRNDTAAQLKSQAEAAAAALRAGLAAFTAPAEPLTSGSVNASIPVTVNYGGAMEAAATTSHQRANRMAELVGIQNRSVGTSGSAGGAVNITGPARQWCASTPSAEKLADIQAYIAAAAEISAKSCSALAAFAALQRLADAAGKLPPSPPNTAGAAQ